LLTRRSRSPIYRVCASPIFRILAQSYGGGNDRWEEEEEEEEEILLIMLISMLNIRMSLGQRILDPGEEGGGGGDLLAC
jgi:hypothetical protein